MGGSHASHDHDVEVVTSPRARRAMIGTSVLLAVITLGSVLFLWPTESQVGTIDYLSPGVTQRNAEVLKASATCPVVVAGEVADPYPDHCNELTVTVLGGPEKGTAVVIDSPPDATRAGLVAGDQVRVLRIPGEAGQAPSYGYVGVDRNSHLALMSILFLIVVVAVARLRGFLAIVGLMFAGLVIWRFMLPALLAGSSGWAVALAGSSLIMFVVLYLAHGFSLRTTVALLGTLLGVGITALIGAWGLSGARVSGMAGEAGGALFAQTTDLNFSDLVLCAVIIAGLGVLNDVTITQASSVWELRAAGPELSRRRLMRSGMRIGRDHIASTIYTIAFAYAGTSLALLALVSLFDRPLMDLLLDEGIAEEIVRTFASGMGLILAVPITTVLAVLAAGPPVAPVLVDADAGVNRS